MKRYAIQGILGFLVLLLMNCTERQPADVEPLPPIDYNSIHFDHSMKGWELYSWPNGNDWNFSVVVGTNILKSYIQVTEAPVAVTGIESLKKVLEHMPESEEIVWIGEGWLSQIWTDDYRDLMLPDEEVILAVNQFCQENGLLLTIVY